MGAATVAITESTVAGTVGAGAECWHCAFTVDCSVARMCLAHPTGAGRMAAVVRAVRTMRANLAEPLSLTSLAHSALLSPFHFHRVFRHVTATTPARFLAALRMAEAKRMLACSSTSVTEICSQVGYASLGTFTSQFTRLVGMSPRTFRELMAATGQTPVRELLHTLGSVIGRPSGGPIGVLSGGPPAGGPVFLGLFTSGVPQQRPVSCAVPPSPGVIQLGPTPDGVYQALAVGFDPTATVVEALADHRAPVRYVGCGRRPVTITDGRAAATFQVVLRRPKITDAPLVLATPLLVAAELAG